MAARPTGLRGLFLNNKAAKAASLFLAVVTWYAIQAVISFETVVTDVPLTIQTDDGWAILDRSADSVDVVFRGSQEDVRRLDPDQIRVDVDIRGRSSKGSSTVKIRRENVRAPGAVRPVLIRPDIVTLRLDQEGEKQVAVKADLQAAPPEGYEMEQVVCTPASVTVYGPRQRLDDIDAVHTAPIDLEGRSRSFKKLKMPVIAPGETWAARIAPSNVAVEVVIVERSATREMADVPVSVLSQPGVRRRVDLAPSQVKVLLKGRAELLKTVSREDVEAFVDCSALESGASYDLPVRVQTVPGLAVSGVEPPAVNVTVGDL
ncbi:MAG: CdaR family protein [Verrucomicrobiota bacterium]